MNASQQGNEKSEANINEKAKKKRSHYKKKVNKSDVISSTTIAGNETESIPEISVVGKQSEEIEVFDYEELEEALGGPVELDKLPSVFFAPDLTTKSKKKRPGMEKSRSVENEIKPDFESKKNSTAAQGRYSAVPPPKDLTVERKGKSKKFGNQSKPKIFEKVQNPEERLKKVEEDQARKSEKQYKKKVRKDTENEFKISTPSVKLPTKKDKKSFASVKETNQKYKQITFVKETTDKAQHKPVLLDGNIKLKSSSSADKSTKQGSVVKEYCHPYDVLNGRRNRIRFDRYLDPKICEKKIKEKDSKVYIGTLRINKRNRIDAYVTTDKLESDIFIFGIRDRNRALEGDTVYVELVDLDKVWEKKKENMIRKREQKSQEEIEVDEKSKPKYAGKVIAVASSRKDRVFSGVITISRNGATTSNTNNDDNSIDNAAEEEDVIEDLANADENIETVEQTDHDSLQPKDINKTSSKEKKNNIRMVWFKPIDKRVPLMGIPLRLAPLDIVENEAKYTNLLVVVRIQKWPIDSLTPLGAFVRELGHIGNIPAETEAILSDNGISEIPFSKKALKGLPPTPWSIEQAEINKRRDLRDTRIFTIDPATAKDLDDAVHVTKLDENEFEVGVHIADVSHFVKQHTALDHEAFDRGTSTYLCDRVIPMLPSLLCEELCSLNPGVDRLAFSVIWKMDGVGSIKETWFGKTVIRSCAKLSYDDAQSVIEGNGLPENVTIKDHKSAEVEQDIIYLFNMSKKMRERRFSNGALSINSIRLSFKLNEVGEPYEVSIYEQKDANRLIEEFMLRANMSVAEKITEHYPNEALLRQHSPPHEKSLNEFLKIAENLGYSFDSSSAGSLQESFNAIESEDAKAVLKLLAVKPMQRAKYFCTGSYETTKFRHYALNVPLYTHFTSPIRRFADIIVHRQLEAALLGKKTCSYKKDDVQKTASHCNERKEGAKNSQDMNLQLYLTHYLYNLEKETGKHVICTAIVTQVLKDAFDILVPEYGLEKRIHMDSIPIEKYVYDAAKNSQSVYWKEGIDSSWEWDQKRRNDEDAVVPVGEMIALDNEEEKDDCQIALVKIPEELLGKNVLDEENRMQKFDTFSKLNVRIQVNVERSPPVVNVYPINPFM
ncbi:hypothetical protein G6F62_007819 [Rhizopus arrhizus]|nr:hypothetical protein G6F62_007819 [Rhizopus arrhizus]KAG1408030.1 hypothetical protein G6F58_009552 [Rhizopus delemar]